jgi:multicomponent Na+:H+ antiporter subunit C
MLIKITYYIAATLFSLGTFGVIATRSYFIKLLSLAMLQTGVLVFYISLGKVFGANIPVLNSGINQIYSSPLPHVLMLTAIVVGFATVSVGLSLIYKINRNFETIDEFEREDE